MIFHYSSVHLTWSSLSNPGALPYPPSPAQGDKGSAPPLMFSHRDRTLPSSPCSATHDAAEGEKGSATDPCPMLCPLGLEEASWEGRGSGGLGGGGELGMGNDGSSGTKGSEGGLKKEKYNKYNVMRLRVIQNHEMFFLVVLGDVFLGLTFNMSKGTEGPSGTAATLLHVVTLCGFIDLWQNNKSTHNHIHVLWCLVQVCKLAAETDKPLGGTVVLFLCGNTDIPLHLHIYWDLPILRSVLRLDMATLCSGKNKQTPFLKHIDDWAKTKSRLFKWCNRAPVFVLVRAAPPVFAVMVIWTGITLTAQTRWFLTEFCLVVGQHIVVI